MWRYLGKRSSLSANIPGTDEDSDMLQTALTSTIFSALSKKNLWTSVHYQQSYKRLCLPTRSWLCMFCVC